MLGTSHSAPGPALGYVHQVGSALVELASEGPADDELRLEILDDVSWHDARGAPLQALQVKHHTGSSRLTDSSVDLWRTLKVWLDDSSLQSPTGPALRLITTQSLGAASSLDRLRHDARDVSSALDKLNEAARTSTNQQTNTARRAWLATARPVRLGILNRLIVLPDQGSVTDIETALSSRIFHVLPVGHESLFLTSLLGWWWRVAIDMLSNRRQGISRNDLRIHISDLREQFTANALPVTVPREELVEPLEAYRQRTFVRQLQLLDSSTNQLRYAIIDYYRAYAQMQHWLDDSLLDLAELDEYEERVVEEWGHQFEAEIQALGSPPHTEEELRDAGRRLYKRATAGLVSIRATFNRPFYARGTQHRLADNLELGWHPDFEARLKALLADAPS